MHPHHFIYSLVKGVSVELEDVAGDCCVCGQRAMATISRKCIIKSSFTNLPDLVKLGSDRVCAACAFCFNAGWLRRYSSVWSSTRGGTIFVGEGKVDADGAAKRERRRREFEALGIACRGLSELQQMIFGECDGERLILISTSGKKHIAYRAQVNAPGRIDWIQFEELAIRVDRQLLRRQIVTVEQLLVAGFTQREILSAGADLTGRARSPVSAFAKRVSEFGLDRWMRVHSFLRKWRGSAMFELAVFLAATRKRVLRNGCEDAQRGDLPAGTLFQ